MKAEVEVLIIGMGPVGLLAALLIARQGISVAIVDKRERNQTFQESRSIGIHPLLLDFFQSIDLLPEMISNGTKIKETNVYLNRTKLFGLTLDLLPQDNKFVLSLPQYQTERILLSALKQYQSVNTYFPKKIVAIDQNERNATSHFDDGTKIVSQMVLGCDGKNSTVRNLIGVEYDGQQYNDFYCMADFQNKGTSENIANIFITREGLLESIPLPNDQRRWVVRTGQMEDTNHTNADFKNIIEQRKPEYLGLGEQITDLRFFNASKFIAKHFYKNRVVLLGDAAHIVSPIGGQGMNLGWIAAIKLARNIKNHLQPNSSSTESLNSFETEHKKLARLTIKRSENNMSFGRPSMTLTLRSKILKVLSTSFYRKRLIQEFTMGGVILEDRRRI